MGDVGWRDLLPLLHGNAATGRIASKELVGVVLKDDLPVVFHEIITKLLLDISWSTRINSGYALQLLVHEYAIDLGKFLDTNNNDGKLLILNEFDIDKILDLGSDVELRNVTIDENADGMHIHQDDLYEKKWLKNQRNQLIKRLNLETDNVDITSANAYGKHGLRAIIEDKDLITSKKPRRSTRNRDINDMEDNTSNETWLARLIRFLVVGLMDSRWETRHGSSIGLTSIINGLFPSTPLTSTEAAAINTLPLPLFLVEDIICSGLYLLILDRFLDFGTSISAISPVKEASGMLIGSAMRYCTPEMTLTLNTLVARMCQYIKSDSATFIRHGGLIAYKYILPLNSVSLHPYYRSIFEITTTGLGDLNDDISSISAQVVCSLCKGISVMHQCAVTYSPIEELEFMLRSMRSSAAMLNSLSCRVTDLLEGANSVVKLLQTLTVPSEQHLSMYILVVDVLSAIMSKLYLFTESTKSLAMGLILQITRLISESLDGIRKQDSVDHNRDLQVVVAITRLVTGAICALSCVSAHSLGDLFLVDKKEQNRSVTPNDKSMKESGVECAIPNELMLDCGKIVAKFGLKALDIVAITATASSKSWVDSPVILNEIIEIIVKWEANGADIAGAASKSGGAGSPSKMKGRPRKKASSDSRVNTVEVSNLSVLDVVASTCKEVLTESLLNMTAGDSKNHQIVMNNGYDGLGYFRFTDEVCRLRVSRFISNFLVEIGVTNSISLTIFTRVHQSTDKFSAVYNAAVTKPVAPKSCGLRFVIVCDDDGGASDNLDDDDDIMAQLVPASSNKKAKSDAKRKWSEASTPKSVVPAQVVSDLLPIEPYLLNLQVLEVYLAILASLSSQGFGSSNMAGICECVEKLLLLGQQHTAFQIDSKLYNYHKKIIELFQQHHQCNESMIHYHRLLDASEKWSATVQEFLSLLVSDACTHAVDGARNTESLRDLLHQSYYTQDQVQPLTMSKVDRLLQALVLRLKYDFFQSILPLNVYLCKEGSNNQEKRGKKVMLVLLCHAIAMSNTDSKMSLLKENVTSRLLFTALNNEIQSIISEMASTNTVLHTVIDCCCHLIISCTDAALKTQKLQELVQQITTLPAFFHDFQLSIPKLQLIKGFLLNILVNALKESILPTYSLVMSHVVVMLGDSEYAVRKHAMDTLRVLVPLAPAAYLAQQKLHEKSSSNILQVLLSRSNNHVLNITMSSSPQDQDIINYLNQSTSLFQAKERKEGGVSAGRTSFSLSLREYQLEGVSWITYLRRHGMGAILADEMGLGKTIQALGAVAIQVVETTLNDATRTDSHVHPSLIICPASLLLHWQSEITSNFPVEVLKPLPIYKYSTVETADPDPFVRYFGATITSSTVVITSYETFRKEFTIFASPDLVWNTIILDEAHIIKNPRTAVAIHAFALKSHMRIALSGTPVQNNIEELWSVMNFILPDFLGTYQDFNQNYIKPIRKSFQEREKIQHSIDANSGTNSGLFTSHKMQMAINISAEGLSLLQKLHKQVLPFIMRRTKANVAKELPRKTIIDVHCPLSPLQRKLYGEFQHGLKIRDEELANELSRIKEHELVGSVRNTQSNDLQVSPLKAFTYLKLLSVHPALIISQAHGAYRKRIMNEPGSSGKMVALARLLVESCVVRSDECRLYHTLFLSDSGTNEVYAEESDESDKDAVDESESDSDGEKADILVMDRDAYLKQAQVPKRTTTSLAVAEKQDASADDGTMNSDRDATADDIGRLAENAASADTQDESTGNIRDKILVASTKSRKSTIQNTLPTRSSARISDQNESNNSNTTGVSGSVAQSLNKSNRGNSIHRCLIFAQHTSVLDIVETCVMQKYFPDINYSRLDGSVDPNKRGEIAKKFDDQKNNSTTDDIRILLMTTRACGLGLNLTAADTVIFVEHDWNPYVDMQAMDRAHRIGQTKPVMVYRLLAESTIEARLINIQELKQTIVDELINNSNEMSSASNSSNELGKSLWSSISSLVDNESVRSTDDINRIDYEAMNIESFLKSVSNTN